MRIIPDGITPGKVMTGICAGVAYYVTSDIVEITDAEWDEIAKDYDDGWIGSDEGGYVAYVPFSQYLRELIELKQAVTK